MTTFLLKLLVSAAFTLLIKGAVTVAGHWIAWWAAGLIALVVVFGGLLIIDLADLDDGWN